MPEMNKVKWSRRIVKYCLGDLTMTYFDMQFHRILYESSSWTAAAWKKMQLDVDVSPPANIMTLRLCFTHVTFDLDPHDLWSWPLWPFMTLGAVDMKIWIIVQEILSSHRQTDRQKAMHMSPPWRLHRWAQKQRPYNVGLHNYNLTLYKVFLMISMFISSRSASEIQSMK